MTVQVYQCMRIHPKSEDKQNIYTTMTTQLSVVVDWLSNESGADRIWIVYKFPQMIPVTKAEVILT